MSEKLAGFLWGTLFGTAGIALLSSEDAKKAYTHITAGVLRCKDKVVETATTLGENCQDIGAGASDINEKRREERRAREIADARKIVEEADKETETETA